MGKNNVIKLPQKKRLGELFVTGKEVEFDNGEDEPIVLWVQKLTPTEIQLALQKSRPMKSKVTILKKENADHPEKWLFYDQIDAAGMYDTIDLINFLIQPDLNQARISAESRIADEEEWSKDDYLEGLQEAWREDLYYKFLEDQEDEEAKRVYEELLRFQEKVDAEVDAEEKELIYEMDHLDYDTLKERVVNRLIDNQGDQILIAEFRKQQLMMAVRYNEDRTVEYFESRKELDGLDDAPYNKLDAAYIEISVDAIEGKE